MGRLTGGPGRTAAAAVVVGAAALVATAAPAAAHNQLESTVPADGAAVDTAPASVVLAFDQPVLALGTEVVVLAPDGSAVSAGDPRLVDDDVTQDLGGDLPAGEYRVEWRATSADGHPVSGELSFTAAGPGAGAVAAVPGPSAAPSSEAAVAVADPQEPGQDAAGGSSTAVAASLAAAAAAVAVVVLLLRRRPGARLGRPGDGPGGSSDVPTGGSAGG